MTTVPRGMYSPNHNGLADPERATPQQVLYQSAAEIQARRDANLWLSPLVKLLRRTADRTFGRS